VLLKKKEKLYSETERELMGVEAYTRPIIDRHSDSVERRKEIGTKSLTDKYLRAWSYYY